LDVVNVRRYCGTVDLIVELSDIFHAKRSQSMADATRTVHLRITGIVQGVCFRAWTAEHARMSGLTGWVRNRRDGAVEALFHGASGDVAEMIELCRQGPPAARVDTIEIIREGGSAPDDFTILPSV
jgi:acylphosphatase